MTEAGRAWLAHWKGLKEGHGSAWCDPSGAIAAIEAEATAAAEQRLRDVERALRDGALPAMAFAATRLDVLGDDSTARDLWADIEKITERLDATPSASPRQGEPVEGLDELAGKAGEYIEAVVTYLDPANQFTHSRRRHVDRTGEELAELVAAALSEPAES